MITELMAIPAVKMSIEEALVISSCFMMTEAQAIYIVMEKSRRME